MFPDGLTLPSLGDGFEVNGWAAFWVGEVHFGLGLGGLWGYRWRGSGLWGEAVHIHAIHPLAAQASRRPYKLWNAG